MVKLIIYTLTTSEDSYCEQGMRVLFDKEFVKCSGVKEKKLIAFDTKCLWVGHFLIDHVMPNRTLVDLYITGSEDAALSLETLN